MKKYWTKEDYTKYIGQKFGKWLILNIGHKPRFFKCQCDCGTVKEVTAITIIQGHSKSCGCVWTKIKIGDFFTNWVVLSKEGRSIYKCQCKCGTVKLVQGTELIRNLSRSCGCFVKENPYTVFTHTITIYKSHAKTRNLEWLLSQEEAITLFTSPCFYCGDLSEQRAFRGKTVISNGIDRKNNKIGYSIENSVSCCSICNYAKRAMSEEKFIAWIERASNNLIKKGKIKIYD